MDVEYKKVGLGVGAHGGVPRGHIFGWVVGVLVVTRNVCKLLTVHHVNVVGTVEPYGAVCTQHCRRVETLPHPPPPCNCVTIVLSPLFSMFALLHFADCVLCGPRAPDRCKPKSLQLFLANH